MANTSQQIMLNHELIQNHWDDRAFDLSIPLGWVMVARACKITSMDKNSRRMISSNTAVCCLKDMVKSSYLINSLITL
ncbi:hypothetical protein [Aliirhizobium cellulosilyticum]|uniref:Uncharacterized protein n=1 Tax=Aliirhizobium cellulosilyticum TaxID=393664 RepID=A0A7W6SCR4_9HYPH|nr:hypothetical protein [Rhizobium cellulosilyticum]MBB4350760.1 hypothetical protein [Rhizobium cellulosilyticum]MBB4413954.1 hypothetical protein [Rhizobium cellulosilyticum]MBB4448569.1 hypothetical protein [Rhizobium cellulosilyticum]